MDAGFEITSVVLIGKPSAPNCARAAVGARIASAATHGATLNITLAVRFILTSEGGRSVFRSRSTMSLRRFRPRPGGLTNFYTPSILCCTNRNFRAPPRQFSQPNLLDGTAF